MGYIHFKMHSMHQAIHLLRKIPKGKVATYKEIARVCRTSPRAIGRIMGRNSDPVHFPCYKVVSVSGHLRGYSAPGGLKKKRALLAGEGITFTPKGAVDKKHFYSFP